MMVSRFHLLFIIFVASLVTAHASFDYTYNSEPKKRRLKHKNQHNAEQKKQQKKENHHTAKPHGEVSAHQEHPLMFDAVERVLNAIGSREIKRYFSDLTAVDKSFDKRALLMVLFINDIQTKIGISGNVGEIGVMKGKSFIPMALLTKKNECAAAIDSFEHNQSKAHNARGTNHLEPFLKKVIAYWSASDRLKVLRGNALNFTPKDYLALVENGMGFRMFNIDGSREAIPTYKNMQNAVECLVPGGVISVDDYFKSTNPAVSEGVNAFMGTHNGSLKPFFIGFNKVFFTHNNAVKKYVNALKQIFNPEDIKVRKFFGVDILVYDEKV